MAKKKSRFQEIMEAAKDTLVPSVPELDPIVPEVDPVAVLHELESSRAAEAQIIAEMPDDLGQYATVEQKKAAEEVIKQVIHPGRKKAYNIWHNKADRSYYKDTLEYDGDKLLSFTSERLTTSEALAMVEAKKIFSYKLILKKEGV